MLFKFNTRISQQLWLGGRKKKISFRDMIFFILAALWLEVFPWQTQLKLLLFGDVAGAVSKVNSKSWQHSCTGITGTWSAKNYSDAN